MKKYLSVLLAAIFVAGCFSACSPVNQASAANNDNIRIVTTIFPEYDWVMNVLGKNPAGADVTMLLDNGVDLHSYQPTADDILKISTCDLFIYVGGESDEWVDDALKEATNKNMVVINLLNVLGDSVKEEEVVEGMQGEEDEHDHEEGAETESEEHEEIEYDEHVWLSLVNASVLVQEISDAVQKIDPEHADTYKNNSLAYTEKLNALAFGYLLMNIFSTSSNLSGDVCSTLFGSTSILTLTQKEVWLCTVLSFVVVIIFILFYNRIFAVTFDESFSKATGTNVGAYNFLIAVIIAVIIVLAMNLVGSLLISALVIFPALSAMRLFRNFRSVTLCSAVLSVTCALSGMIISILAGTPVGSTIVAVNVAAFAICYAAGRIAGGSYK